MTPSETLMKTAEHLRKCAAEDDAHARELRARAEKFDANAQSAREQADEHEKAAKMVRGADIRITVNAAASAALPDGVEAIPPFRGGLVTR